MFYVSVPFAVATERNAEMVVIFSTLDDDIINNKLGESLNILTGLYFDGKRGKDSSPFFKKSQFF